MFVKYKKIFNRILAAAISAALVISPLTVMADTQAAAAAAPAVDAVKMGDAWTVVGQWIFRILSCETVPERVQIPGGQPPVVYEITYCYANMGYTQPGTVADKSGLTMDLSKSLITDAAGMVVTPYPMSSGQATAVSAGRAAAAKIRVGAVMPGRLTAQMAMVDSLGVPHTALFTIDTYESVAMDIQKQKLDQAAKEKAAQQAAAAQAAANARAAANAAQAAAKATQEAEPAVEEEPAPAKTVTRTSKTPNLNAIKSTAKENARFIVDKGSATFHALSCSQVPSNPGSDWVYTKSSKTYLKQIAKLTPCPECNP